MHLRLFCELKQIQIDYDLITNKTDLFKGLTALYNSMSRAHQAFLYSFKRHKIFNMKIQNGFFLYLKKI